MKLTDVLKLNTHSTTTQVKKFKKSKKFNIKKLITYHGF